jgi:hypothetical protein
VFHFHQNSVTQFQPASTSRNELHCVSLSFIAFQATGARMLRSPEESGRQIWAHPPGLAGCGLAAPPLRTREIPSFSPCFFAVARSIQDAIKDCDKISDNLRPKEISSV